MELDKLDKVAMLARSKESRAAETFQRSQQALDQSTARRSQLQQFKEEYEQRLQAMSSDGMDARQLADYRLFLSNLNDAINRQEQDVHRSETELESHRETLVDSSMRRSSVDELVYRGRLDLLREADKRDQQHSDEISLQRHDPTK